MSSLDLTRDWLKNVLRPYPSRDIVQAEVLRVLQRIPSLAVKTDAFTFDSGSTALLLLLHGTLPITYRGASYHIPVHIWFPHEYPRAPPMVFVVPTKDMGVRKGREVEPGGRVREEALAEAWSRKKDLDSVLAWLTDVFSAVPPVYAKPASAPPRSSSMASGNGAVNGAHGAGASSPAPAHAQPGAGQPVLPARPHYGPREDFNPTVTPPPPTIPGYVQAPSRQSSASYPQGTPPPSSQSPPVPLRPGQQPPPPPRPVIGPPQPLSPAGTGWAPVAAPLYAPGVPQGHQQLQQYPQSLPPQGYQSPPPVQSPQSTGYQQYAPQYAPQTQTQPQQQPPQHQPQHPPQPPHPQMPQRQWTQPTPPHSGPGQAPPGHTPAAPGPPPTTLAPPARTVDLLSSPDVSTSGLPDPDAPPPLPPSKPPPPSLVHLHAILLPHIQASLPPVMQGLQASKAQLLERHEDLASGEPAIRDEMARLEAVKNVCDAVGTRLDGVVAKGSERVADLESRGDVSVDEVVCSISIVHNQLVDLVAEDNALSDTIYHVTRALDAERIDLDKYIKAVRSLAREQYMKRALIERIAAGMGGSAWSVS